MGYVYKDNYYLCNDQVFKLGKQQQIHLASELSIYRNSKYNKDYPQRNKNKS